MGNLTSPKFPEDEIPGGGVLHPDGVILGGLRERDFSGGLNLIADRKPLDFNENGTVPNPQADDGGFYTGLTPYAPDPDAQRLFRQGLNGHGYVPAPGDANLLARLVFAEGASTPQDMDALGWAAINRVGDREFGPTLDRVLHRRNAFEPVQKNSPLWRDSADPQRLTGPNAAAWQRAQDTAQGILGGVIPDPINGAPYFFSKPGYNGYPNTAPDGFYRHALEQERIAPVFPLRNSGTNNYFFNRNPYSPKK